MGLWRKIATGFMRIRDHAMLRSAHFRAAALALLLVPATAVTQDIQVVGLGEDRAIMVIDGGKPRTLRAGQTSPEGVKLISSDGREAVVEIAGKRQTLGLGRQISASSPTPEFASVTLMPDARGHFIADALFNGAPTKVLVDTGASLVVMSSQDAKRMGVSYLAGEKSLANTANGVAPFYRVTLNSVKVGGVTLRQVDAGVMEGNSPHMPLLGMSFLNRVEMNREGSAMTLRQRY